MTKPILGVVVAVAATSMVAAATWQAPASADPFASIAGLVGRWTTASEGQPGNGTGEREYERVYSGRFIRGRSRATYPPQEKNPKGEVHEDWGLFSYDRGRKQFVLRQFHVEGFVNQYALDRAASNDKTLVFVTESIENIPAGWRARESYRILNNDEFVEIFELAAPGKEFEVYAENRFKRKK
jgi:hypothetical protein